MLKEPKTKVGPGVGTVATNPACVGIQFVMSLAPLNATHLVIGYGQQDCESRVGIVALDLALASLRQVDVRAKYGRRWHERDQ